MGSNARARFSLAIANPASFKSPMRVRLETTQDGGGSQPKKRHGLAVEVLRIIRRREIPVRGVFGKKYSRTHHFLRSGDSILVFYQPLP
jgi:hypothetical protein